jgi:hypothetical protein
MEKEQGLQMYRITRKQTEVKGNMNIRIENTLEPLNGHAVLLIACLKI